MCGVYIMHPGYSGCSKYNALVGFPRDFCNLLHSWSDL